MATLHGSPVIETSDLTLVWSQDPDVKLPPELDGAGWVESTLALEVGHGADLVTVRALGDDETARYRDHSRTKGTGTGTLYTLRAAVIGARYINEKKKRVTVSGKGCAVYVGLLVQRHGLLAELLSEVVHRITQGLDPAGAYATARASLGIAPPPKDDDEAPAPEGGAEAEGAPFQG